MEKKADLLEQRKKLRERIKHLENDLKKSLDQDPDANALDEENREFLENLYKVEKENLVKLDADIERAR
jgi:RNA polymerase-binding transcription factor DksA